MYECNVFNGSTPLSRWDVDAGAIKFKFDIIF